MGTGNEPQPRETLTSENLSPEHDAESRAAHLQAFRWLPGQSGNPAGRNRRAEREVAARLRDLTRDAADPLVVLAGIVRGYIPAFGEPGDADYCPPVKLSGAKHAKLRAQAAIEVCNRIYGKAVVRVESEHTETRTITAEMIAKLDPSSLAQFEEILTCMAQLEGEAQIEHRAAENART